MSTLAFELLGAAAESNPAMPALRLRVRLRAAGEPVDALALRVRVQIEPWRRRYTDAERELLADLSATTALQWGEAAVMLGRFENETEFEVPLLCTYDLQVAASKYFTALEGGAVPVRLFFNGTIFRGAPNGFTVEMLPWDLECAGEIPVATWQQAMDACFSGQGWIRIDRDAFDALRRYRASHNFPDWTATIQSLVPCQSKSIEGGLRQ